MNGHIKVIFRTGSPELLLALLAEYFPFEGFIEGPDSLEGWISEAATGPDFSQRISDLCGGLYDAIELEKIEPVNWNAQWEASYEPVVVGNFCTIRASFHKPADDADFDIVIDPKMAFGTGHHATTFMMVGLMKDIPFKGRRVLDLGCGTGVLAILACKLGAKNVDAVDVDPNCVENSTDNMLANGVSFEVFGGDISAVADREYDIVLANVNRNALLEMMPVMAQITVRGGTVIISGILGSDEEQMKQSAAGAGFEFRGTIFRDEWASMTFEKS